MRMTLVLPALFLSSALAGCGGGLIPATSGNAPEIPAICAEQSEWARLGRTDGRDITITCPEQAGGRYVTDGVAHNNSYIAHEEMYRAGNAAMIAVGAAQ